MNERERWTMADLYVSGEKLPTVFSVQQSLDTGSSIMAISAGTVQNLKRPRARCKASQGKAVHPLYRQGGVARGVCDHVNGDEISCPAYVGGVG